MKFTKEKISKLLLTIASLAIIASMSFTCIGCDNNEYGSVYNNYPNPNPNAYTQNSTKTIDVPNGGTLTSFVQRQSQGELVGESLSVDYQVKAIYVGNCKVNEIRSTWNIYAQFRRKTGSSATASITVGKDTYSLSIGESSSNEYASKTIEKYYVSTNGIKEVVYASNYLLCPYKQLNSQSLQNTALVRIQGYAGPTSVSWAA